MERRPEAIAGHEIPALLTPAEFAAHRQVEAVLRACWHHTTDVIAEVCEHARSLPPQPGSDNRQSVPALATPTFGPVFGRLMRLRNVNSSLLARMTLSAEATVNVMRHGERVPAVERVFSIAAALGLRGDDVEAMAGYPDSVPPDDPSLLKRLAATQALGELVCALVPLPSEQLDAVTAHAKSLALR
ncbi:hypothetical protein ACFO1B_09015 [Dactylosporangium siamense]|uniref:hypothetical protein n=1 Tax=Dactylosporangium siamense TaxID=685454 RepID=UPI002FEDD97C